MDPNGKQHINKIGENLTHFATNNNITIASTFFKKKDIHKFTWSADGKPVDNS